MDCKTYDTYPNFDGSSQTQNDQKKFHIQKIKIISKKFNLSLRTKEFWEKKVKIQKELDQKWKRIWRTWTKC